MRNFKYIQTALIGTIFGTAVLFSTAKAVSAQSVSTEYIRWQEAKQAAEARHDKYLATGTYDDYAKWQKAQELVMERDIKLGREGFEIRNSEVNAREDSDITPTKPFMVKGKLIVPEKARESVSLGYMYGYMSGHETGEHGNKYNDTAQMPYRYSPSDPPVVPSHRYRTYYDEGYTRGYEDGYKNTTRYGTVSKIGNQKGYSMYANEVDSIINASMSN